MSTSEGLTRIAKVVKWVGYSLAGATIVISVASNFKDDSWTLGGFIAVALLVAILGGVGWTAGWIIEGFAKE